MAQASQVCNMDPINILYMIVFMALVGFAVYLVTTYIPMAEIIKQCILVLVAVMMILWVIGVIAGRIPPMHLGYIR